MRIVVQKFGGTSVAAPEGRQAVADRILQAREEGRVPVVVVSAMGRAGEPYATDSLISLAKAVYADTPPRDMDLLISCGEIISAVILGNTLRTRGVEKIAVLTGGQAGIITDRNYGNARILRVEPDHIRRHLERGDLAIVAGFQGHTETGDITTLGRGGSDTTAAALGVGLRAEVVEIYTDVDGVKTADPRIVPSARTLKVATYEEIFQLANEGAKVVHPRAVELAMRANLPLRVRNTFDQGEGTLITHTFEQEAVWSDLTGGKTVTAVTYMPNMARLTVYTNADNPLPDVRIFRPLADAGISLDLFNVSPDRKSFIVRNEEAARAKRILEKEGFQIDVLDNCAKVAVVGAGMHGVPGVMASVVEALDGRGIQILQTADSHVTISCLVRGQDMEQAVRALHEKFGLNE